MTPSSLLPALKRAAPYLAAGWGWLVAERYRWPQLVIALGLLAVVVGVSGFTYELFGLWPAVTVGGFTAANAGVQWGRLAAEWSVAQLPGGDA